MTLETKAETKIKTKTKTKAAIKKESPTFDLQGLRYLLGNWWRVGPLYSLAGASQSGKTTWALQLGAEYSHKTGRAVCLYDTEGGGQEFLDAWMPIHKETYPNAKAVLRTKRNWRKILHDHGIPTADVEISKGGKMKVVPLDTMMVSPMDEFCTEKDVGMIIYDSMTMPMQAFGSNQENFPVRASAQQLWMHQMIDLSDEHDILCMITNHVTANPTDPYRRPELAGGKAVHHNCKVQFYIKRWEAKGITHYRTVKLDRFYDVGKGTKESHFMLTDNGYEDRSLEELKADRGKTKG